MSARESVGPASLRRFLARTAGGWLVNTVARPGVTCVTCRLPTGGPVRCPHCRARAEGRYGDQLADRVGSVAYAVKGQQSGHVMHGYKVKAPGGPVREHVLYVALLAAVALLDHARCAARLAGLPITQWSVVPSLPGDTRPGEHPLRPLVAEVVPGTEVPLVAAPAAWQPRDVHPAHYAAAGPVTSGGHVLVVDDTWVTGGHAQSAALAVRAAGAGAVSVLTLTRWIRLDHGPSAALMAPGAPATRAGFDPTICPWTATTCPAPSVRGSD